MILYSNIMPMALEEDQKTIIDCFHEQAALSDQIEIAVGYLSRSSLDEIERIVDENNIARVIITAGMYFVEGMPEGTYRTALKLNEKWKAQDKGEIRLVRSFKYHAKLYIFMKEGAPFSVISGSANMGVILQEASNRRQYEIANLITSPEECNAFLRHVRQLEEPTFSANIGDITGLTLIREQNVSLNGIDLVERVAPATVEIYAQAKTDVSFTLPIKVPTREERFMDDGKHFTKSNINVCYAAPRNARKSRDWYEVQMTVAKEITRKEGYPEKNVPFFVVTDDGYWFKAHTTSDGNKQFSAVGDELIMGRWIKGRLAAAGLVDPVNDTQADTDRKGMITKDMLEDYGCNAIVFSKTDQKAPDGDQQLDVWTLSFAKTEA